MIIELVHKIYLVLILLSLLCIDWFGLFQCVLNFVGIMILSHRVTVSGMIPLMDAVVIFCSIFNSIKFCKKVCWLFDTWNMITNRRRWCFSVFFLSNWIFRFESVMEMLQRCPLSTSVDKDISDEIWDRKTIS